MNDPVAIAPSGAIHQKRALPKHASSLRPIGAATRPTRERRGVSGTTKKIHSADAKVAAASATKMPRQESTDSAAASGAVDSSAPMPPATIIQPASEACRSAGYQVAMALSGAIRHTATPAPISARARTSPARLSLAAKASAPNPRSRKQHRLDAPRPEAVEQHPRRELHRCESDEVSAGQEAQRRCADTQTRSELRRDHRIDRAVQIRQQIGRGKAEVQRQETGDGHYGLSTRWERRLLSPIPASAPDAPAQIGSKRVESAALPPRPSSGETLMATPFVASALRFFGFALCGTSAIAAAAGPSYPPTAEAARDRDVSRGHAWSTTTAGSKTTPARRSSAGSRSRTRSTRRYLDAIAQRPAIAARVGELLRTAPTRRYDFQYRVRLFALKIQPPKNQSILVALPPSGDPRGEHVVLDPNELDSTGPHGDRLLHALVRRQARDRLAVEERQRARHRVRLRRGDRQAARRRDPGRHLSDRRRQRRVGARRARLLLHALSAGRRAAAGGSPLLPAGLLPPARHAPDQRSLRHRARVPAHRRDSARRQPRRHAICSRSCTTATEARSAITCAVPTAQWREVAGFKDGLKQLAFGDDGNLYGMSIRDAALGRIIAIPASRPSLANARVVIPEEKIVAESVRPTRSLLYVTYLRRRPVARCGCIRLPASCCASFPRHRCPTVAVVGPARARRRPRHDHEPTSSRGPLRATRRGQTVWFRPRSTVATRSRSTTRWSSASSPFRRTARACRSRSSAAGPPSSTEAIRRCSTATAATASA